MNTLTLAVLLSLCAIATARFACGNDALQSQFAEILVKNDCKGRMGKLDKCCKNHTKCYMAGTAQLKCDENFCKCSTKWAAKGSLPCTNHANTFCTTAKTFGLLNYERLKNEGKLAKKNKH